ncbi:HDOD domain-containing protein [Pseudodesulfovibrio cashew]|uniref:HDOD domain-containing protein n=1 Tax=Pseudodesulfovibrio cashew TaxID=2678688 RepID=A0A6I6JE04_9BACT|nr:response regulator [Pseudodesulfovibrio cashew]QGY38662.1 HDOD domain-containing protein [Pseudodesulfovibrio cashew]
MTARPRILFVDDEPNILAALKRMLRSKRDEWEMVFVESGLEALEKLKDGIFDVVISDIRMPGMDGAELLNRVKESYPKMIRIALSGQVDLNEVIHSIRAVHQYITKPCNAEYLIDKIEGALHSRRVLTDVNLLRLVTEIDALPVVPQVFLEIEKELAKEEPDINRIAEHIAKDVGLVAEIIKLVNSPYFGLPAHVDSLHKAITLLGLETIKALVLSSHLFSMYDSKPLPKFSLNKLWAHCFRVSNIAYLIAECDGVDRETLLQCRMAGILHDIGKLILCTFFPERYGQVLETMAEGGGPICTVEERIYGTTHAEVGAYLMGLWGISGNVVHAIGFHHDYDQMDKSATMYLSVANVIDHHCVVLNEDYVRIKLNASLAPLVRDRERMERWMRYLGEHWSELAAFRPLDADIVTELADGE